MQRTLLFIVIIIIILLFGMLKYRETCPDKDQVWVMSDGRWVCVRPTYVP